MFSNFIIFTFTNLCLSSQDKLKSMTVHQQISYPIPISLLSCDYDTTTQHIWCFGGWQDLNNVYSFDGISFTTQISLGKFNNHTFFQNTTNFNNLKIR